MAGFSAQQIKILGKLIAHPPVHTSSGIPEKFLLQFIFFEALARLVGHFYRDLSTKKKKTTVHAPLHIDVVERSFEYFGITTVDAHLRLLLDSNSTKRGCKSARELRNGLVHQWKAEDVKEVNTRRDDLSNALTGAIDAIKARVCSCGNAP